MSSYINRYTALLTFTTILIAALLFDAGGPVLGQGPDPEPTLGGDSAADYLARATHFAYTVFDTPAAIADATAAINLDPALLDAYILRGQQFLWMSMPVQAAADFNEALKLDPDSTAALVGRAEALFFNPFLGADIALAQADLNRALDLDSDNAAALTLLGLLAFNVALEIDEADALFARAIEADPAYARAYMERATAQALRGRGSAEALSNIQQAADLWGDSPFGVNARAIWLLDTGDTEAGWDEYQRGIAQFPHFPLLYSWASARAGDISDQLALISAAVDLAPESPILLLARGTLYGNNREFDL
ncbi:MAG: hypothetical protein JXQ72_01390, partial [Anaerolineae bacterium]|nr:hypothetical protein [Anaerolineae bacterium]